MTEIQLHQLLKHLLSLNRESEWVEFKQNYHGAEEIGTRISALSNGACLGGQPCGYLVFGIYNDNQTVVGTSFLPATSKHKGQDLEHWLLQRLNPRIDFQIHEFLFEEKRVVLFEIPATHNQPVNFQHIAYIRVSSITRQLLEFPEKERKIWRKEHTLPFEREAAYEAVMGADVVKLLHTDYYFELLNLPYPTSQEAVLRKFISEQLISVSPSGYTITNLGALLFAKSLDDFGGLKRKAPRVIVYKNKNKLDTLKDFISTKGYAVTFQSLVEYINDQLPQNEEISRILRETLKMYPETAVRELVANALIHQDFREKGNPTIEIYTDRIEFSNPGLPVITLVRFIDEYQSRNEILADLMRRLGICEEKGSGIDRVVGNCEMYQLPAPDFQIGEKRTRAIMYAHQTFSQMDRKDRLRACYQHCCLKYVSNEKMTNQTLRERFQIEEKNYSIVSRIIREAITQEFIKEEDSENKSRKYAAYVPFWA